MMLRLFSLRASFRSCVQLKSNQCTYVCMGILFRSPARMAIKECVGIAVDPPSFMEGHDGLPFKLDFSIW